MKKLNRLRSPDGNKRLTIYAFFESLSLGVQELAPILGFFEHRLNFHDRFLTTVYGSSRKPLKYLSYTYSTYPINFAPQISE